MKDYEPILVRKADYDSLILDKIRVRVARAISDEFAETVEFHTWRDDLVGEIVWALEGVVLAERLAEKEITVVTKGYATFRFPTSPWQYFKQRHVTAWWMRWLVRRRPIRLGTSRSEVIRSKRVRLEQFATFPMSPIRTPEKYRGDRIYRCDRVTVLDR